MLERFRHRFLNRWSHVVSGHPWLIIIVAMIVAAGCIGYTATNLTFKPNRNDLLSEELPWNKRFIEWQSNFSGNADFVVAIDTWEDERPSEEKLGRVKKMVDKLGPELAGLEYVKQAVWGFDPLQVSPRAVRLLPWDQFTQQMKEISQSKILLESETPQELVRSLVAEVRNESNRGLAQEEMIAGIEGVKRLVDAFTLRMRTPAYRDVDFLKITEPDYGRQSWEYLMTENQRLMLIRLTPRKSPGALTPYDRSITSIREVLDRVRGANPGIDMGLTGIDVVETDETDAANLDSIKASIIAAILIAALLITSFHSYKSPLMMLITLGIGIAWAFGFLTGTIGHLQLISVIFTVILLGLGIDFGIHITTRFEIVRHDYPDDIEGFAQALTNTFETVGPGLLTGALTTAAALATTMFTDYAGVAEMGMIASAGIILCLIAMFSVYPAMLRLFKFRHRHITPIDTRVVDFFKEHWIMPFVKHPVITLVLAGTVTVLAAVAVSRMKFDYNLLELLPKDVPSVEWQRKISEEGDQSIWFGVSVVDSLEKSREFAKEYRQKRTVESLGGVGLLIPDDEDRKVALIKQVREGFAGVVDSVLSGKSKANGTENPQELVGQMNGLKTLMQALVFAAPRDIRTELTGLTISLNNFTNASLRISEEHRAARLKALQKDYATWRVKAAGLIDQTLDTSPLTEADMPQTIISPYVTEIDGKKWYALEIFPKVPEIDPKNKKDQGPLSEAVLKPFIGDMRAVDPNVTGVIVQIYESGTLIWSSYLKAGGYALAMVFVLLWIDFKILRDTILCLLPVLVGFALTFGVLWVLGIQINPANIIVLPLMFGIGVDAGVHVLHRYKQDRFTRPLGLSGGTGKGISLTSYTTMIGFGSLMVSQHRGMAGLGFVMMLGIGMTLLGCWLILPTGLELRTRQREKRDLMKKIHGDRHGKSKGEEGV